MIFRKNKRGMIFVFMLGLLFGTLIMTLLFIRLESKRFQFERKIGDLQSGTIGLYLSADKILFYIDESARYASNQAIFDLGLRGGHVKPNQEHQGYPLWVADQGEDYPKPAKNLLVFAKKYLNEYLEAYEGIPLDNYDFLVKQGTKLEIIGIATINLNFDKVTEIYSAGYSIKPSFKVNIDYNLNDYELLKQISNEMIAYVLNCEKDKKLSVCIPEAVNSANVKLKANNLQLEVALSDENARIYGFDAKSSKKVIAYNPSAAKTDFWPVIIKFALQFPKKQ